jgi:hypothetical protein
MVALAVVPLRGIRLSDESLSLDPFSRPWTILSLAQAQEFQRRYPMEGSVHGNFDRLKERLGPDAYLLVECTNPTAPGYLQAYDLAETILGALCVSTLLAPEDPLGARQYVPRLMYWTRTFEYCDLPLVIDRDRVALVVTQVRLRGSRPMAARQRAQSTRGTCPR